MPGRQMEAAMAGTEAKLVTSEEFVTDLLCELKLNDITELRLVDTKEDKRFARAFERLLENQDRLNIALDFSLVVNPYHGDSSTLREALYSLRERGVVAINNPSFKTVEIRVDQEDANYYLDHSSIPRKFTAQLVEEVFKNAGDQDATR
jgi:hypothetical protein